MSPSTSVQALFTPFTVGSLTLSSRIVMAPMTRGFSPEGVPGPNVADYYRRRAEHGVGLIVTEGTVIDHPEASNQPSVPHFHGEAALAGWANVVQEVHRVGGKIVPQIWHMGTHGDVNHFTADDIAGLIQAFADAAAAAKRVGFDGIELHGAHGYLIDQFLWEQTNARTDEYGGSMLARARFAIEVVAACREAVGPDFPIILRLSQWKSSDYQAKLAATPEQLGELLAPLVEAGVDMFHCSTRRFWEPEFEGSSLNFAGWAKKLTGKPTITVGSVGLDSEFTRLFAEGQGAQREGLDQLLERLEQGEFDLVAVGRALLQDPEWAAKIREGRTEELKPFGAEALQTLH
ncbi:12-oxophytodienoate reductase [Paenibacillus sp. 598K]|uniref:NADH:flavin oxidoreductase n=1 Tax=Paenibacillus sp. 598K TaxID=1117987 RepID=UPI000FFAC352|nr:NADH:flavin oxidoreductase [Paenibacillus sp. 598K]GBF74851.1 12-oxophytodienoate reductase [Paenibacillus sp. 598K]